MKFLITGGAGFIGSHLCTAILNKKGQVFNVDNFDPFLYPEQTKINNVLDSLGMERGSYTLFELSTFAHSEEYVLYPKHILQLEEGDVPDDVDIVIHLAGYGGVRPSIENPMLYVNNNIRSHVHLLELCRKKGINKFIFASSSSVYGNNHKVPFSENDNVDRAISPYASTKKSMEVMAHTYHSLYDIDVVGLRFFTCYGARQRPDLAIHKFTKLISQGEKIPFYGDGSTMRDYTYIDDIIDGVMKSVEYILSNKDVYEIFNLGNNRTISLSQMVSTIEYTLGKKANKYILPEQSGDVKRTYADISKAQEILGYSPSMPFYKGIRNFVEWYKEQ